MANENFWLDDKCAEAFWDQHLARPYQEMLTDTAMWVQVRPGQRWLDLGCGGGHLTSLLWRRSKGRLGKIVSVDCAAANVHAIERLKRRLKPEPDADQITFRQGNFSDGLGQFATGEFDGIISGLAISYAESKDPKTGQYTDEAYNALLGEMHRVLKPGGSLVFSVNVPEPNFWRIFWESLGTAYHLSKPAKAFLNAMKMQRYGHWLCREARVGRFHYFEPDEICRRLSAVGFTDLAHQVTYAEQAYLIAATKPAHAAQAAA